MPRARTQQHPADSLTSYHITAALAALVLVARLVPRLLLLLCRESECCCCPPAAAAARARYARFAVARRSCKCASKRPFEYVNLAGWTTRCTVPQ